MQAPRQETGGGLLSGTGRLGCMGVIPVLGRVRRDDSRRLSDRLTLETGSTVPVRSDLRSLFEYRQESGIKYQDIPSV